MAAWVCLRHLLEASRLFAAALRVQTCLPPPSECKPAPARMQCFPHPRTQHFPAQVRCCWASLAMAHTWCRTPASRWQRPTAPRATPCSSGGLSPASAAAASGRCRSSGGCWGLFAQCACILMWPRTATPIQGQTSTPLAPGCLHPPTRTQPYLDALADEEQFMPADGMVLTVAEAPDSSLLGALHARVAACSLVCNAQGRAALRCSCFAAKEPSVQTCLPNLLCCSGARAVGGPGRHRQPGASAQLPDPHPRAAARRRSPAAGERGQQAPWGAHAVCLRSPGCRAAAHAGSGCSSLHMQHVKYAYALPLPILFCAGGAPGLPHGLPTLALQPIPRSHAPGGRRQQQCRQQRP